MQKSSRLYHEKCSEDTEGVSLLLNLMDELLAGM